MDPRHAKYIEKLGMASYELIRVLENALSLKLIDNNSSCGKDARIVIDKAMRVLTE